MNFFRRILEKLLYLEEDPKDSMAYLNRRWRWWPGYGAWNGRVYLGLELQLIQFKGEVDRDPRPVQEFHVQFVYDPRKWKFGQTHAYYDGPHCFYEFGPIVIYKSWGWCTKCMPPESSCGCG